MRSEAQITRDIMRTLKSRPHLVAYKIHQTGAQEEGIPDIAAVYRGKSLWIEVKTDDGVISPMQAYQQKRLHEAGAVAITVTSAQEVEDILVEIEDW